MVPIIFAFTLATSFELIADFEQKTYGLWKTTGTAFGTGPAQGSLPNQMAVSGYLGKGLVNSYLGGDTATGTLTSPLFTIKRRFINFLIGGGFHPGKTSINLVVEGKTVLSNTGGSKTPQDSERLAWANWDVQKLKGKLAYIQIVDLESGGWGHINVDEIMQSDKEMKNPIPLMEPIYQETYRPQFHFTAKKNWLNDPNGLVFVNGEYHLFFQHNPGGIQWGDMHWGHAVSKDLFHWKELPIALAPDNLGTMYSGSADIDFANTSGFGKIGKPPMVAMYTAAGKPFTQCLAYSTDSGRTWTKYSGNPVLKNIKGENRDPRIFWHKPSNQWIMALYLDGDEFGIFGSPNLKEWKELSRLHLPGSSECPELFEMPVEGPLIGGEPRSKWVFFGGNFRYLVGTFDGRTFSPEPAPENEPQMIDFGQFYASQTYSNVPDGRRIQIGWMNGPGPLPGMPFNQQMSVPCDLTLRNASNGYQIWRTPVPELSSLRKKKVSGTPATMKVANALLSGLKGGLYDIEMTFQLEIGTQIRVNIGGHELLINPAEKEVSFLGKSARLVVTVGEIKVRMLIDRSSVEFFMQGGESSLSSYLPASNVLPKNRKIRVTYADEDLKMTSLVAYELKPVW